MSTFSTEFKPLVRRVQIKEQTLNRLIFDPPRKPIKPMFGRVAIRSTDALPVEGLDRLFYEALCYATIDQTEQTPLGMRMLADHIDRADSYLCSHPKMLYRHLLITGKAPSMDISHLGVDMAFHFTDKDDPSALDAHGVVLLKWIEVYEAVLDAAAVVDKLVKVPVETIIAEFSVIAASITSKLLKIRYQYNSKRYAELTATLVHERMDTMGRADPEKLDHLLTDLQVVTEYIGLFCKTHKL